MSDTKLNHQLFIVIIDKIWEIYCRLNEPKIFLTKVSIVFAETPNDSRSSVIILFKISQRNQKIIQWYS